MSSHYSGQRLKPFVIYIQHSDSLKKDLIHFCKKYRHTCFFCFVLFRFVLLCFFRGGGEGLVFVCFTQQSSLLKPVHLFILLII